MDDKVEFDFRAYALPIFIGGDTYGDGRVYITDQGGLIYTHTEAIDLVDRLNKFYAEHTDEMIEEYNQHIEELNKSRSKVVNQKSLRETRKGYVYLIKNRHTGNYKIGISKNVASRLKTLNSAAGGGLELLHTIESSDMRRTESELHERFAFARLQNEWFALQPENVEKIQKIVRIVYGEVQS